MLTGVAVSSTSVLARAAEQALHRPVPSRVLVTQGVGLVDDHEAVGVLGVVQMAARACLARGSELLVGRELVEGDDLRREPRLVDPLLPHLSQLGGGDDERVVALAQRVLLDEGEPDLGLAGADAVGVDHAVVLPRMRRARS